MNGKKALAPKLLKSDEKDKNCLMLSKVTVNTIFLVLLLADSVKTVCRWKKYFMTSKKHTNSVILIF